MPKGAAQAIWGHLPTGTPEPVKGRTAKSLAETMFGGPSGDERLWKEICERVSKRNRDNLVRGLDELNRKVDQRQGRP
jgi:hypothetical protein